MFSALKMEKIPKTDGGRQQFKLLAPLAFICEGSGYLSVRVPRGFVTDGASVPRPLWVVFPPFGKYSEAAVVHDYLCKDKTVSRFLADAVFREAMAQLGVPMWKRCAMYYGCRSFAVLRGIYWRLTPWVKR